MMVYTAVHWSFLTIVPHSHRHTISNTLYHIFDLELQNTSDRDDISLTDASQLDTDFPVKSSDSDPTIGPVDQSVGGSLTLYLESGETCRLRLNTSTDYGQCLLALYSIMNKNKLLRGYPDIG